MLHICSRMLGAGCVTIHPTLEHAAEAWCALLQATVPSWAPSDAPFVWDTTATSVTLGWPEPASNGGNVTGYEVRACSDVAAQRRHKSCLGLDSAAAVGAQLHMRERHSLYDPALAMCHQHVCFLPLARWRWTTAAASATWRVQRSGSARWRACAAASCTSEGPGFGWALVFVGGQAVRLTGPWSGSLAGGAVLPTSCLPLALPSCRFRVRAENEAGRSLWSPLGEGRTSAVPPGPCGPPSVLGTSQTSLTLRWEVGCLGAPPAGRD